MNRTPRVPPARQPPGAARPTAGPLALAAPGVNAALSAFAVMANDPKLQGLYFSAERPRSEALYLQLFCDLQLSPAQIARFEDLVMRRREQWLDLVDTMQAEGLAADDPAVVRLQQQIAAEFRAGQLDLLGDAGYAHSPSGWWQAVTVGHPQYYSTLFFFRNSLMSDLLFTGCFALAMEYASLRKGRPSLLALKQVLR